MPIWYETTFSLYLKSMGSKKYVEQFILPNWLMTLTDRLHQSQEMHSGMTAASVFLMQHPSQPLRQPWRELRKHFSLSGGPSLFDVDNYSTTSCSFLSFQNVYCNNQFGKKRMTRRSSWFNCLFFFLPQLELYLW